MKQIVLLFMTFATISVASAQLKTPQPSPSAKLEQKVGLTDVTITYSRPGVKGRKIFGDLVPYGALWRTGANSNTTITFSTAVSIDGQTLEPGSYAIYSKPYKDKWEVFFYTTTDNWGLPKTWDESKVAAKTTAKVAPVPFVVETFTIDLNSITNNGAHLEFIWEQTYVGIPFELPTNTLVTKRIKKALKGPDANDYFKAAVYYFEEGKDLNQAKEWMDKAIEMTAKKPRFWMLRKQSLIYEKLGDTKGAIAAAKASLKQAKKAGNANYIKLNTDSLKAWGAL
jgi:hypothetical protein